LWCGKSQKYAGKTIPAYGSCCVSRFYFRFGCLAMCKLIILCTNRLNPAKCRKFISSGRRKRTLEFVFTDFVGVCVAKCVPLLLLASQFIFSDSFSCLITSDRYSSISKCVAKTNVCLQYFTAAD